MPQFSLSTSVDQGFNFRKDRTVPVGFITAISINGQVFPPDIICKDPLNPTTDLPAFAVLNSVSWGIGITDTLQFSGQISGPNRNDVMLLTYQDLANVEVKFKFNVYDYDQKAKTYFLVFHCDDTELQGILEKRGEDLSIRVSDLASTEVESPINYTFTIGIKSQQIAQTMTLATENQKNVVKQWGLSSG